ncbi:MAG TPA: anhydro-N-acetylmuramic acid kinase [Leeuwenhoekiella sp.]|nr:anhydro-N-acetylmuramic acid kinase [Leeuwenhoekiella sp.]
MKSKDITSYTILGIMSGTSVDGIDFALTKFTKHNNWTFEIIKAKTAPYPKKWQEKLRKAVDFKENELVQLDKEYTEYLAAAATTFMKGRELEHLDAIASHGHTILHRPDRGITYQIGNKKELATLTGQQVICDFRVQDVKLGGQGAPLVPIGDYLLFGTYDACINIGGFANISYQKNGERIAYDICPTNIVLNHYAEKLGLDYDKGGQLASEGDIDQKLLKKLNKLPFYAENPPKSLGLEWVKQEIFPLLETSNLKPQIIIATFTEHMAQQIARVLTDFNPKKADFKALVTGGGAYNTHLIKRLEALTALEIIVPEKQIVEFKEALVFAFMGTLRLRNTVNILKSVTGAQKDHCSGVIFTP